MRPLPSPPSAALQSIKSNDSASFVSQNTSAYSTPLTAQSFVIRLPIGVEFPKSSSAPRLLKARRREGRIFHSPSSSVTSFDSASSLGSIVKAEFWMPPEIVTVVPIASEKETTIIPPTTPTTPKTKTKSKPANIMIPRNSLIATVATIVSPTSPAKSPVPFSAPALVAFPATLPLEEEVLCASPLSPFLPLSPLSPNRRIQSPNARIRKIAKLTRTLGENIPIELVFPGTAPTPGSSVPSSASPAPAPKPSKRAKLIPKDTAAQRVSPLGPRARLRPVASPEWPLTPTPDCTLNVEAHTRTAVGLHYALGLNANSLPTRSAAPAHAAVTTPTTLRSPPPFTSVFNVDDVSWERARLAVMAPRTMGKKEKAKRVLGGVRKVEASGCGAWRKKENTWSGEWNVEDMEELQVRLRRLRRL
ncbi:hypothetical protein K438DRAFT_1940944 [Mycena galopus ATCC 62051]|nr:hypothetical protein K438DRAFT_1940944 [Mycena galopus ATCC 62051]